MVIERGVSLKEIERTGIEINGLITSQLLINIFEHNTPLHDGAVVIRGNRIVAATCYLPLSDNTSISKAPVSYTHLLKMSCKNVSKTFRSPKGDFEVLKDLTFDVHENEFLVIFGPGQ